MSAFNCTLNTHLSYRIPSYRQRCLFTVQYINLCYVCCLFWLLFFMYYFTCISFAIQPSRRKSAIKLIDWWQYRLICLYCIPWHWPRPVSCPFTSTAHIWDVILLWRKRNIEKKLSLCYSIVYHYNGAQWYEQFLQVGFDLAWFSSLSSERFCIFDLHGAIMVVFLVTSFSLPFSELSLVGLALDLVD